MVLSADNFGRKRTAVGQLRQTIGTGDGEPQGPQVLLLVAAAERVDTAAVRRGRALGRREGVHRKPPDVLPAAVDRRPVTNQRPQRFLSPNYYFAERS